MWGTFVSFSVALSVLLLLDLHILFLHDFGLRPCSISSSAEAERERERHAAFDPNYVLYISRGKQASVNRSVNAPVATSGKNTSVNTRVNTLLRISKNKAATPAARDFNRCTPFFCLASGQPFSSIFYFVYYCWPTFGGPLFLVYIYIYICIMLNVIIIFIIYL